MKKYSSVIKLLCLLILIICMIPGNLFAQTGSGFHVAKVFHIVSSGGWDYIAVGPDNNRLYVSHGTQVNVLDETTVGLHWCYSEYHRCSRNSICPSAW